MKTTNTNPVRLIEALNTAIYNENARRPDRPELTNVWASLETLRAAVEASPARSAWAKGVKYYAGQLLENYGEALKYARSNNDILPELNERTALNGADNWGQYSYGGCSLIYDVNIAATLCSPSELKRYAGGRRDPSKSETWLDVQARALRQAWLLIVKITK